MSYPEAVRLLLERHYPADDGDMARTLEWVLGAGEVRSVLAYWDEDRGIIARRWLEVHSMAWADVYWLDFEDPAAAADWRRHLASAGEWHGHHGFHGVVYLVRPDIEALSAEQISNAMRAAAENARLPEHRAVLAFRAKHGLAGTKAVRNAMERAGLLRVNRERRAIDSVSVLNAEGKQIGEPIEPDDFRRLATK